MDQAAPDTFNIHPADAARSPSLQRNYCSSRAQSDNARLANMMASRSNDYSRMWFDLFLSNSPPAQAQKEADFIIRWLPTPTHHHVLDLCCGTGRHIGSLCERGYEVIGLDRSMTALDRAKKRCPICNLVVADMNAIPFKTASFDAVICLWQSFGYLDDAANLDVLKQIRAVLRPGGRLLLDVYHRGFLADHLGVRDFEKSGRRITESKTMTGNRLFVELTYDDGAESDRFDWRLYDPDELIDIARVAGFSSVASCSNFDVGTPPSPALPRMQIVLES